MLEARTFTYFLALINFCFPPLTMTYLLVLLSWANGKMLRTNCSIGEKRTLLSCYNSSRFIRDESIFEVKRSEKVKIEVQIAS